MEIECVKLKGLQILARQNFKFLKINPDYILSVLCPAIVSEEILISIFFSWPEAKNSSLRIHLQQSNLSRQQKVFKTHQIHSCEGLLVSICTLHLIFLS